MLYVCKCCDWQISDRQPDLPLMQIVREEITTPALNCPRCGAVVAPEHFSPDEISGWLRKFSRCKNACSCYHELTYRPECEKLSFYPGCLAFMWRELKNITTLLENIADKSLLEVQAEKFKK